MFKSRRKVSNRWLKIFGYCEEDVKDVISVVLKSLYKTGFKSVINAEVGNKRFKYEDFKDLEEMLSRVVKSDKMKFILSKGEIEKAHITVKKFYPCRGSSTMVYIEKVRKEDTARFLNLIKEKGLIFNINKGKD